MEEKIEYVFRVQLSSKEMQKLAKDIFENFPEYGQYAFKCEYYDYSNFIYIFEDEETTKKYAINLDTAVKGLLKFFAETLAGNIKFTGIQSWDQLIDSSNYDVNATDAVLQYAIFGELIYS